MTGCFALLICVPVLACRSVSISKMDEEVFQDHVWHKRNKVSLVKKKFRPIFVTSYVWQMSV